MCRLNRAVPALLMKSGVVPQICSTEGRPRRPQAGPNSQTPRGSGYRAFGRRPSAGSPALALIHTGPPAAACSR